MPFFSETLIEKTNKKKYVTLQVQTLKTIYVFCKKRVFLSILYTRKICSLTIEAALILPLFLFGMMVIISPLNIMDAQRQIQEIIESTSQKMSQYAYLKEPDFDIEDERKLDFLKKEDLEAYLIHEINSRIDSVTITDITLKNSKLMEDEETIQLILDYKIKMPFIIFSIPDISMQSISVRRAWIGEKRGVDKSDWNEVVYIGKNSTRFHRLRTCHYLYNNIRMIQKKEIITYKNQYGSFYTACKRCDVEGNNYQYVYIMPSGRRYHYSRICSSILSYVEAVPLSQVYHLGPCSYCSKSKGE